MFISAWLHHTHVTDQRGRLIKQAIIRDRGENKGQEAEYKEIINKLQGKKINKGRRKL